MQAPVQRTPPIENRCKTLPESDREMMDMQSQAVAPRRLVPGAPREALTGFRHRGRTDQTEQI